MAIAWCSPSPRQNPPKAKEEEAGEEEEEDENVQQLEQCARAYKCLEDCLVKTDRNWRACQEEVRALKECHDAKANKQPSSVSLDAAAQERVTGAGRGQILLLLANPEYVRIKGFSARSAVRQALGFTQNKNGTMAREYCGDVTHDQENSVPYWEYI